VDADAPGKSAHSDRLSLGSTVTWTPSRFSSFVLSVELPYQLLERSGMAAFDAFVAAAGQRDAAIFGSADKFFGHLAYKLAGAVFAAKSYLD
jgi:hypothetical protein